MIKYEVGLSVMTSHHTVMYYHDLTLKSEIRDKTALADAEQDWHQSHRRFSISHDAKPDKR